VFGLDVRVVPDPEEHTPMCVPAKRRRRRSEVPGPDEEGASDPLVTERP
jgi:hypothetical protein